MTSPGEPASHSPTPEIVPTPSASPGEAEDQGVEKKIAQPQPPVNSIKEPPVRRTWNKASAPALSFDFVVTSVWNSEARGNNARLRGGEYLTGSTDIESCTCHSGNP